MTTSNSGNVPHIIDWTIDSKGNITPKPFGVSRWSSPRKYKCSHKDCTTPATILSPGCFGLGKVHNCCYLHKEEL